MSNNVWKWTAAVSFTASAALLAGLLALTEAGWPKAALIAAIALLLVGVCAGSIYRKRREAELKAAGRRHAAALIGRYRHDWMNDLQVLLGYAQLNRHDQVKAQIANITEKLCREGLVAKLGILELTDFLINFRTETQKMELTVLPAREISLAAMGKTGRLAAETMIGLIRAFHDAVAEGGEAGKLAVAVDVADRDLVMRFSFSGRYDEPALRRHSETALKRLKKSGLAAGLVFGFQPELAEAEVRLAAEERSGE